MVTEEMPLIIISPQFFQAEQPFIILQTYFTRAKEIR
jgi:hypothetical protein